MTYKVIFDYNVDDGYDTHVTIGKYTNKKGKKYYTISEGWWDSTNSPHFTTHYFYGTIKKFHKIKQLARDYFGMK